MRLDKSQSEKNEIPTSVVITARCAQTGQLGYAYVGTSLHPHNISAHAIPRAGICLQIGTTVPNLCRQILKHLSKDPNPKAALAECVAGIAQSKDLQVLVVTAQGSAAAHTGRAIKRASSSRWAGHSADGDIAIAGQQLPNEQIMSAMATAFKHPSSPTTVLSDRLLTSLESAVSELDPRFRIRAAALSVTGQDPYPLIDLRVDASSEPVHRLRTIYDDYMNEEILIDALLPTAEHPYGIIPTQWGEMKRLAKRMVFTAQRNWQNRAKKHP